MATTTTTTTTTAFPSLSVPAPDDTMEVSSPGNHMRDTDIDLDFGDGEYDGGVQLLEDEQMLTDTEQTRPATATDDMMDDDVQVTEVHLQEAEMDDTPDVQQPPAEPYDEELIDYGDDEDFGQQQIEDTTLVNAEEGFNTYQEQTGDAVEQVDEEIVRQPDNAQVEQHEAVTDVTEFHIVADAPDPLGLSTSHLDIDQTLVTEPQAEMPADEHPPTLARGDHDGAAFAAEENEQPFEDAAAEDELGAQPSLNVDTTADAPVDAPGTPTDTGLHPMTLYYGEHSMPLFRSKHQPEGLLKDDNIASLSLHEFMRNCRERLAIKIGNVPEEQELTLAFDHMGLMLVDSTRAAFESSLNDVLEVYLHLHQNDAISDVPPLSLALTHQRFSSQLAMLKQAAQTGLGMSHFVPVNEQSEGYYDDGHEHGLDGDEFAEQEEHQEQQEQYGEDVGGAAATEVQDEVSAVPEDGNHEYQQEEEYRQEGGEYADELDYAEEPRHDEAEGHGEGSDEQGVGLEGHAIEDLRAEGVQQESPTLHFDAATNTGEAEVPDENAEEVTAPEQPVVSGEEAPSEAQTAPSTASSETVRGDSANDGAGEYPDEDIIDWDDDSSLTSIPPEHAADGQDDFSTFLTEYEAEEAKATQDAHEEQHAAEEVNGDDAQQSFSAGVDHESSAEQHAAGDDQDLHFGAEDFLNNEAFEDDAIGPQDDGADNAGGYEHDQDYYDQADTTGEQQEEAYQPPVEDDQHLNDEEDFLDVGDHEHGLEYQPNRDNYADGGDAATVETSYEDQHAATGQDPYDLEDDIGFDDETTEQHEARKAAQPEATRTGAGSPLGKRSFEEHADDEIDFDDEPDLKKVRSE